MYNETFDSKLPVSHGAARDDFALWQLRVQVSLRGKDVIAVLTEDNMERRDNEKEISMFIAALGYSTLRSIQNYTNDEEVYTRLQQMSACRKTMNKLSVLNILLITRYDRKMDMADDTARLELQCLRL